MLAMFDKIITQLIGQLGAKVSSSRVGCLNLIDGRLRNGYYHNSRIYVKE